MNKKKPSYPDELINLLKSYHFPGNIRELESMIYNAISMHNSKMLSISSFETYISERLDQIKNNENYDPKQKFSSQEVLPTLKENSNALITEALERSNNNIRVAAKILGISPQALHQRLKKRKNT